MKERTGTVNCMIATIIICIIAELIGPLQFKVMGIDVKILTMIWVIIMGILLSPTLLGKVIPPLKKFISKAEIKRAPFLLSLTLYPLGIMFGINAGPKVGIVLQAGPALLFQEAVWVERSLFAEIRHLVLSEINMVWNPEKEWEHLELILAEVYLVLSSILSWHRSG